MSDAPPPIGSIAWTDLTVDDADLLRDFYAEVVGWRHEGVDMGGYQDHCMQEPASARTVAGVCHSRGPNVGMPAQWLVYIAVADWRASAKRAVELGGEILHERPGEGGRGGFCVIRDPAGAVCALYEVGAPAGDAS